MPDVNVLVNAVRDDTVEHERCRRWLDQVYRDRVPFGFTEMIGAGVLRTLTNSKVFASANKIEDALAILRDITSRREFMWLNGGHDHWTIFEKLCRHAHVKGNLVNDAWIAAVAIEADHEVVTLDRDFGRFPGLKWREP
jgi:uncharacterized protein